MKKIPVFVFVVLVTVAAHAQLVMSSVTDSTSGKPLPYAAIIYAHGTAVTYADEHGSFYIHRDSLFRNDSLFIEYLGFYDLHISTNQVTNNAVFKMVPQMSVLSPVIVTDCRRMKDMQVNKTNGKIHHYIGPGPETKFIIISRFDNRKNKSGYVTRISLYTEASNSAFKMPVRIRWYEWNDSAGTPGKELTSTEILVTPYKPGWNNFDIPEKTIYCHAAYTVLGFEFIYPAAYIYSYQQLKNETEKIKWLNDMKNRWSLGTVLSKSRNERSFYIINNLPLHEYVKQPLKYYVKPAVAIRVRACIK